MSNAGVLILGHEAQGVDALGGFSVSGVIPPYDLAVMYANRRSVVVYQGVTRADPTLVMSDEARGRSAYSKLTGSMTGARKPGGGVAQPRLMFVSTESAINEQVFYKADTSTYDASAWWASGVTSTGSLLAFQWEWTVTASLTDLKLVGFGRRDDVSLRHESSVSALDITLEPVATTTLTGAIRVPEGFTLGRQSMVLDINPSVRGLLFDTTAPTSRFNYEVPVLAEYPWRFTSTAYSSDDGSTTAVRIGETVGTQDVDLTLKTPSRVLSPPDGAAQVTHSTEFSWSERTGGVHVVSFANAMREVSNYDLSIVTTGSRTTIPDVSALGLRLPSRTPLRWSLSEISPIASVDELLADTDPSLVPVGLKEYYVTSAPARVLSVATSP